MNSKSLIRSFGESYNENVIMAVDKLSTNSHPKSTLTLFNLQEDVSKFHEYINGFIEYKLEEEYTDTPELFTSMDTVLEKSKSFINSLHQDTEEPYSNINEFVKGYLEAVEKFDNVVLEYQDRIKDYVTEPTVLIAIEELCEFHMDHLTNRFNEKMEYIVGATGAVIKEQTLFGIKSDLESRRKHVFM